MRILFTRLSNYFLDHLHGLRPASRQAELRETKLFTPSERETQPMRRAFVMLNADLGSEDELQSELKKVEGVVGVHQVYGVYDMVVEVEAESDQKLREALFS